MRDQVNPLANPVFTAEQMSVALDSELLYGLARLQTPVCYNLHSITGLKTPVGLWYRINSRIP